VPKVVHELLARAGRSLPEVDHLVFHQANRFMLDALRRKVGATPAQVPVHLEAIGNTVSSTIPFVLAELMARGELGAGKRLALVGFGVGLSWAAAWIELTEDLR
jgi:3-oxoacyl-[acyl-carrier-protein] synthase III